MIGGSDAHTLRATGCVYTEVPGARTKDEFLKGLRKGSSRVTGVSGNWRNLTRDILAIGADMMVNAPVAMLLAPLAAVVPFVALVNNALEIRFSEYWGRELGLRAELPGGLSQPGASFGPERGVA